MTETSATTTHPSKMDLWLALRDEAQREQAIAQLLVMPLVAREDVDCMLFKAGIHDGRQRRALIAKVLGEQESVDEDQDVLGTDVNFLRAYLSHGASTEGMDRFTQQVLAQTDPRRLQAMSAALLDLIQGSDSPDRFHERFTLLSLVEVLQARFADFALQEGKKAIHRLSFNPFFVTKSTVDNLYWSFEIHRWVYLPSETSSERDRIREVDEAAERRGVTMGELRRWENDLRVDQSQRRSVVGLASTNIPWMLEQQKKLVEVMRAVCLKEPRFQPLMLAASERYLAHLTELAETFVRVVRVQKFDASELAFFSKRLEGFVAELLTSCTLVHLSDVPSASMLNKSMDIVRDLQGFLRGEVRDMQRDAMLRDVVERLRSIDVSMHESVRQLGRIQQRLQDVQLTIQQGQHAQGRMHRDILMSVGALGLVLSSMRTRVHVSSVGRSFFSLPSTSVTTTTGPTVAFDQAYQYLARGGRIQAALSVW